MLSLALVPLAPWLYVEVYWFLDRHDWEWPGSDLALPTLIVGGISLAACGLIWLMDPVWRKGRGVRAALAWAAGIAAAALLVVYHDRRSDLELGLVLGGLLGVGVWCVAAGVLARRTSAGVARVLYALALVPLVPVLSVELLVKFDPLSREDAWFLTTSLTGALVVVAWLAIWRRAVAWTAARAVKTLLVLAIGVIAAVAVREYHRSDWLDELGSLLGGLCFAAVWLAGTGWAWRPTAVDRLRPGGTAVETVYCPKCRYDLRGLREARCPECGTEYTLDALVRAAYPTPPPP